MVETLRVLVLGDDRARDMFLSESEGGGHLDVGLAAAVAEGFDGYEVDVRFGYSSGIGGVRAVLENPSSEDVLDLQVSGPDVVVMGLAADVVSLFERTADPTEAVLAFREDLIAVIDAIKDRTGAHVLVCNVSTFDPDDLASNLYGLEPEPISMRAHRVDLALLEISHLVGVSLIDVDRVTAEAGCDRVVPEVLNLTPEGSALVRDEAVRVLADYGFFDSRSVVAQVGNRGGAT